PVSRLHGPRPVGGLATDRFHAGARIRAAGTQTAARRSGCRSHVAATNGRQPCELSCAARLCVRGALFLFPRAGADLSPRTTAGLAENQNVVLAAPDSATPRCVRLRRQRRPDAAS